MDGHFLGVLTEGERVYLEPVEGRLNEFEPAPSVRAQIHPEDVVLHIRRFAVLSQHALGSSD